MKAGPKIGEKWSIAAIRDLTFIGQGYDFIMEKFFLFQDPINGHFVITKDEFYAMIDECEKQD